MGVSPELALVIVGDKDNRARATTLLKRIAWHCQWRTTVEKVQALLHPQPHLLQRLRLQVLLNLFRYLLHLFLHLLLHLPLHLLLPAISAALHNSWCG